MVTSDLFEAYLACPTKCFLKSTGEVGDHNPIADWKAQRIESYRCAVIKQLPTNWEMVLTQVFQSENLLTTVQAVQTIRYENKRRVGIVPLHFVPSNNVSRTDRLTAAFDALVISGAHRARIELAKVIYGDKHSTLSLKTNKLFRDVHKTIDKITELMAGSSPPKLALNHHCPECEYKSRCKQNATQADDLSLLANLTERERLRLNREGIFTVHQLSYTFRPRRRAKRFAGRPEKYHHSLKALAIRESKIHVVGSVRLPIDRTAVFLDIEGVPDRDFFYLIGIRVESPQETAHHHFWADSADRERELWAGLLSVLSDIEKPVLLHYGSYEKTFLEKMARRYGPPSQNSSIDAIQNSINVLSVIYASVYFPTYSNGLKEIAAHLGFEWSDPLSSGLQSIVWRYQWEESHDPVVREKLIAYNTDDCAALSLVFRLLRQLDRSCGADNVPIVSPKAVTHVEAIPRSLGSKWRAFQSSVPELLEINRAAYWNYQRDRVFVRTGIARSRSKAQRPKRRSSPSTTVLIQAPGCCPQCGGSWRKTRAVILRSVQDLVFGNSSVKRRSVNYTFQLHRCRTCKRPFVLHEWYERGIARKWGWNVRAYVVYHTVALRIPQLTVKHSLNRLFGFELTRATLNYMKSTAAEFYSNAVVGILERIVKGNLIHIDETTANIKGELAYVWVMTNLHEVVYILAESREGDIAKELLKDFRGVLVSDFYAAYDSIECKQQKCLIHLMRDLNDEILNNPFDEEMKSIVLGFAALLKAIVATIDQRGLKKCFLSKHRKQVSMFFRFVDASDFKSEAAVKCQQRFRKNRDKLFTFLDYDGVPWNNNNAEHAIKAFARLRKVISGTSTKKGVEEYLTLLTVAQSCEYRGIDFLDFLRSGETDLERFGSRMRKSRSRGGSTETSVILT